MAVNMLVVAEAFYLINSRYLSSAALTRSGLLGSRIVLGAVGVYALSRSVDSAMASKARWTCPPLNWWG